MLVVVVVGIVKVVGVVVAEVVVVVVVAVVVVLVVIVVGVTIANIHLSQVTVLVVFVSCYGYDHQKHYQHEWFRDRPHAKKMPRSSSGAQVGFWD